MLSMSWGAVQVAAVYLWYIDGTTKVKVVKYSETEPVVQQTIDDIQETGCLLKAKET